MLSLVFGRHFDEVLVNRLLVAAVLLSCASLVGSAARAEEPGQSEQGAAAKVPPPAESLKILHDPAGWEAHERSAREGVEVFKKDIAGFRTPAFRGEKTVAVASDLLFGLLVDVEQHVGMSDRVPLALSWVLRTEGDTVDFFQLLDTPGWTMARDRCWFNRAEIKWNVGGEDGRHLLEWRNLEPSQFPETWEKVLARYPGALAIPVNLGSWEVLPLGPNSSRLIYRVVTDPGGRVPANLQEFVTGRTLPDNLLQFEEVALQRAVK